ncbi:methyltransferase domain protein [Bordetella holmesii 35009]|nr:methyltransferase domain protein [Bordetella holmesii 35009]
MSWSAKQYSAFENERTRPVRDLVAAIPDAEVRHAVDLGCGPGNSTQVLADRYPQAKVSGMDSSPDMVAAARKRLPGLAFSQADISSWRPADRYDVILANASLQWVPDHATLYPRLLQTLTPGGSLAVQTPDNLEEPAHRLARAVAAEQPWAAKLAGVRHPTGTARNGITPCSRPWPSAWMCGVPPICIRWPARAPSSSGSRARRCCPT